VLSLENTDSIQDRFLYCYTILYFFPPVKHSLKRNIHIQRARKTATIRNDVKRFREDLWNEGKWVTSAFHSLSRISGSQMLRMSADLNGCQEARVDAVKHRRSSSISSYHS